MLQTQQVGNQIQKFATNGTFITHGEFLVLEMGSLQEPRE